MRTTRRAAASLGTALTTLTLVRPSELPSGRRGARHHPVPGEQRWLEGAWRRPNPAQVRPPKSPLHQPVTRWQVNHEGAHHDGFS